MGERKSCPCCGAPWVCTCGNMLQDPEVRCLLHPMVRVKTQAEKAAHATAWDAKVMETQ